VIVFAELLGFPGVRTMVLMAVVQAGSMGKAARQLDTSQPTFDEGLAEPLRESLPPGPTPLARTAASARRSAIQMSDRRRPSQVLGWAGVRHGRTRLAEDSGQSVKYP
jgi:hypothetical protein